jgi:hypothetical protein
MDENRYREIVDQFGFTLKGMSLFLGVDATTSRRWARRKAIPRSVAMLLELIVELKIDPAHALKAAGLTPKEIKFIMTGIHDGRTET